MPLIALDLLEAHPANANVMSEETLGKLTAHIEDTGRYPPLIVRPRGAKYQILDGHHRALALRRLGCQSANCEVWDVDDAHATMLLLTLNRLRGEDDPHRRGELIASLRSRMNLDDLAARLPDDAARIERLVALTRPSEATIEKPPPIDHMPQAVTFFLTGAQRRILFSKLAAVSRDRSQALVRILQLNDLRPERDAPAHGAQR